MRVRCRPDGWLARAWLADPTCRYCGRTTSDPRDARNGDGLRATTEHVTPRSRGGPNYGGNRVIACRDCNTLKGDLTFQEFADAVEYVDRRGYKAERSDTHYKPIRYWGSLKTFWDTYTANGENDE